MREWMLGLLMIGFFALGIVYIQGYFIDSMGLTDDIKLSGDYNLYGNVSSVMGKSEAELTNQSLSASSASESTLQGAWATIRRFPMIIPITFNLLSRVSEDVGLPSWMLPIFVMMIMTVVVFWIIYWIGGLVRPGT